MTVTATDGTNTQTATVTLTIITKPKTASVVPVGTPGTPATALSSPAGVAVDRAGDLYIADAGNNRIVEYSAAGGASVVNVGSPDGTALSVPFGVAVDGAGDLYISDSTNNRIVEWK